ncbi:MAG: zinc ribbon domain-containing protein [Candidatus Aenigmarchaeota archaeon]|nr:zinc ribbon domain-containing protein [Candidatus Aenigmarchaeota archaeon]
MNCENCNTKLKQGWNFCPNCGLMIGSYDMVEFLNRQIRELTKRIEEDVDMEDIIFPKNITITISPRNEGTFKPHEAPKQRVLRLPKDVVEPESHETAMNDKYIVVVKLPGVKDKKDISVNVYSKSVEIRAIAGNKGYFKIINIPPNFNYSSKRFENEELKLLFE